MNPKANLSTKKVEVRKSDPKKSPKAVPATKKVELKKSKNEAAKSATKASPKAAKKPAEKNKTEAKSKEPILRKKTLISDAVEPPSKKQDAKLKSQSQKATPKKTLGTKKDVPAAKSPDIGINLLRLVNL